MTKYHEPELIDPRTLVDDGDEQVSYLRAGDQVGCLDGARELSLITTEVDEAYYDVTWVKLCNDPGTTTDLWGTPVPYGSAALDLADIGWRVMPLPRVLARRQVAP